MDAQQFCQQVLEHAGITSVEITQTEDDNELVLHISIPEEDVGLLIGRHGETLVALQRLARVLYGQNELQKRLVVDVNDYRTKRRENIRSMLITAAEKVLETNQPTTISTYLSPSERFFVHSTLGADEKYATLESFSIGEGRGRRIVIQPKESLGES